MRSLLGVKGTYNEGELKKPFIIVRYMFSPPVNDPEVRKLLIQQSTGAAQSIYGGSPQPQAIPHFPAQDDFIDIPPVEPDEAPEPEDTTTPDEGFTPMDPDTWDAATNGERIAELTRLSRHVIYDLDGWIGDAKKIPDDQLYKLFNHLCGMVQPAEDDIPF